MALQFVLLSLPMSAVERRLLMGIVFSIALHVLLLANLKPDSAPEWKADPITIEIKGVNLPESESNSVDHDSDASKVSKEETHAPPLNNSANTSQNPRLKWHPPKLSTEVLPGDNRFFSVHEVDMAAKQINDVDLIYPKRAYATRTSGKVLLTLFIDANGDVTDAEIIEATPPGVFDETVLTAALALKFRPAIRQGSSVKSQKTIEVVFDPYERINVP